MALTDPDIANAKTIIGESDISIQSILPVDGHLYLSCLDGGPSIIRIYSATGMAQGKVPNETNSAVYSLLRDGQADLLFLAASYVSPSLVPV